jgi:hypothetical protein
VQSFGTAEGADILSTYGLACSLEKAEVTDSKMHAAGQLAKRLFNVTVEAADGDVPVWDPSVRFFRLYRNGQLKAHFYLDSFARPGGEALNQTPAFLQDIAAARTTSSSPCAHMFRGSTHGGTIPQIDQDIDCGTSCGSTKA